MEFKLRKEKEQAGKTVAKDWFGDEGRRGKNNIDIKIIIAGVIVSLIGLGVNQYVQLRRNQIFTEQCERECCSYVAPNKVWVDKCDILQNCTIVFNEIASPESCTGFPDQKSCIDYCFTELKKKTEPKIPSWLRLLRNFF